MDKFFISKLLGLDEEEQSDGSKGKKNSSSSKESSSKETRSGKRSREASSSNHKDGDSNGVSEPVGSVTSLDAERLEPTSSCSSLETEGASSRAESSDSPSSPDSFKNSTGGDPTTEKRPKRARTSFTATQLQILEFYFMACPYPDTTARSQIASTANIDENTVQVWFQNRRARYRKREQPHHPLQRPLIPMGPVQMDAIHNYILHAIANPGHVNPFYQSYMPFMNYPMPFMSYPPQVYNQQMMMQPPLPPQDPREDASAMAIDPNEDSEQTLDAEDEIYDKDMLEEDNDEN